MECVFINGNFSFMFLPVNDFCVDFSLVLICFLDGVLMQMCGTFVNNIRIDFNLEYPVTKRPWYLLSIVIESSVII